MKKFPVSVILDVFDGDVKETVSKISKLGIDSLQINTSGKFSPENLSPSKRREILDIIKSNGMNVAVVCGDMGVDFSQLESNQRLVERSKRILDLAVDLQSEIVTSDIGAVPDDINVSSYAIMQEACREVGWYAKSAHAKFAIDFRGGSGIALKEFISSLGTEGIAVNFDLRVSYEEMKVLKDSIVHSYIDEITQNHIDQLGSIGFDGYITLFDRSKDMQEQNLAQKIERAKNLIIK